MSDTILAKPTRRPRFRRASESPPFRLTDGDVEILRHLARHRFLRSTHISHLVGRSVDRTNDRLCRLFHAGYVDRPRAQLDYYPTTGSGPMVYALGNRGARLLDTHNDLTAIARSRNNGPFGRPFIEHQLEIMDFLVALQRAVSERPNLRFLPATELVARFPKPPSDKRNPFSFRLKIPHNGSVHEVGLIPDLVFGLMFPDGSRRCFMVEIDRGTMPVVRSDIRQTSYERKMRAYLAAHTTKLHEQHFGWKTFRILTITTDNHRMDSMTAELKRLCVPHGPASSLFYFNIREKVCGADLLVGWHDANGRNIPLV
jgi:hypothetical protein